MLEILDSVIIGTGPAGLTAAIYLARGGKVPHVYAGLQHGGQLTTTTDVENFPGFADGIMGPKLMMDMATQAERVGAQIIQKQITKVDLSQHPFRLSVNDEEEILTKTLVISTGATAKTLNLEHEKELMGRGVSTCATCDGFFFKNKEVMVVGGGDSAMEEALYLANICKKVVLVHRRDVFRASDIMLNRAKKHKSIEFKVPFTVDQLGFDNTGLTHVELRNTETDAKEEMKLDGLFYGIGHSPNSKLFADSLDLDDSGYVKVHEATKTKVDGVFAAGDIADPEFKQAITSAGMGCQAAMQALKFLENLED